MRCSFFCFKLQNWYKIRLADYKKCGNCLAFFLSRVMFLVYRKICAKYPKNRSPPIYAPSTIHMKKFYIVFSLSYQHQFLEFGFSPLLSIKSKSNLMLAWQIKIYFKKCKQIKSAYNFCKHIYFSAYTERIVFIHFPFIFHFCHLTALH